MYLKSKKFENHCLEQCSPVEFIAAMGMLHYSALSHTVALEHATLEYLHLQLVQAGNSVFYFYLI